MNVFVQFENQVFISYAHIDNESLSGPTPGWIDLLHTRLEKRLAMLLGRKPSIWRDRKLAGHDLFNDTIVIQLDRSALLLSVLSPRYLQSEACRGELRGFLDHSERNGGIRVGDKHRVFKVVKTYVPRDQHPEELKDLLGYEFYERDPASGRVLEFDYEVLPTKDKRYFDKFEDLAQDITNFLTSGLLEAAPGNPVAIEDRTSVYLAEAASDLHEARSRVQRELQQYGYTVLPDKPLPLDASRLRVEVEAYLRRSRLSVHFIGTHYGMIPEGEMECSIPQIQEKLAAERSRDPGFFRLLWMPPGLDPGFDSGLDIGLNIEDARQKRFVEELQANFAADNGSELLQVKIEDLKTIIDGKLVRLAGERRTCSKSAQASIYLACDRHDLDAAQPLRRHLLDLGYEAILPLVEGEPEEILEDRKQNLLFCDAVLIFQANASEAWLKAQLRELLKLPGMERPAPLLAQAFYLAAPQTPAKDLFHCNRAPVVRNYGAFDPHKLQPFLAQMTRVKAAAQ